MSKVPGTGAKTPKAVKVHKLKHYMELIMDAPKVVGSFSFPVWRGMLRHHDVTVSVDQSQKKYTNALQAELDDGNTVVAIFIKVNHEKDAIPWLNMNNTEIIRAYNEPDTRTITVAPFEMEEALGCSKTYMGRLYKQGIVVKHGRGRYDFKESCTNYIKHLQDQAKGKGGQEYSDQRTKNLKLKGSRELLKYKQESEELGYLDDFKNEQMTLALGMRNAMESLPNDLAPRLANKTAHFIKKEIAKEIKLTLETLNIQASENGGSSAPEKKTAAKKKAAPKKTRKKK